jgi:hypothetical protein
MYTERYLPKKYRDSRRRNRMRRFIFIAVIAAAVIIGGYFLIHSLTGEGSNNIAIPTPFPSSASGIMPTGSATVPPSSSPDGIIGATNTPAATDTASPVDTSEVSASPAVT